MAVKYIFFDFDGTLADSFDYVLDIYNGIAKRWNFKQVDEFTAKQLRGMTIREIRLELDLSRVALLWVVINGFRRFSRDAHTLKLFPGIIDAMQTLEDEGYELAVITSDFRSNVIRVFAEHNLKIIKHIYGGSIWRDKKRAIQEALEDFKIKPEEAVYVGDEVRDIQAAKAAGIKVVVVSWGYHNRRFLSSKKPNYIADTPQELVRVIKKLN